MSQELLDQEIVWIDEDRALEEVCDRWHNLSLLAVDTEFMRSKTYYPIAGLIQVNDGEKNYLIDPTKITDFYPFVEILDNEEILKVIHSCSEDLEVLQHALGCLPKNMLDTQIAGAIAGYGFSVGFGKLVSAVLGVDLPKSETRSDWLQRPLSQSQLLYAALDVEYLYALSKKLIEQLEEKQRLSWALDDSRTVLNNFFENQNPERSYLRFKTAWKLGSVELAILKGLSIWREDAAQHKDVPRNRVIKDAAMFSIAQRMPNQLSQLHKFEGLTERMVRSFGEKLLSIVAAAQALDDKDLPALLPRPLSSDERGLLDSLKQNVLALAESLSMPPEILIRKKDYEEILIAARDQRFPMPKSLQGWRQDLVGEPVVSAVKSWVSNNSDQSLTAD